MATARAFRGCRFPTEVILWAGRWYLQFPISYRDLASSPRAADGRPL
jgi:transposase-like protein